MTPAALFDFDCNLHHENYCLMLPRFFTFIWQARGYCCCCDAVQFLSLWSIFTVRACWCLIQVSTVSSWQGSCGLFFWEKMMAALGSAGPLQIILLTGNWVTDRPKYQKSRKSVKTLWFWCVLKFSSVPPATPVNHAWQGLPPTNYLTKLTYCTDNARSAFFIEIKGLLENTLKRKREGHVSNVQKYVQCCSCSWHVTGSGFFCCTSITSSSKVLPRS